MKKHLFAGIIGIVLLAAGGCGADGTAAQNEAQTTVSGTEGISETAAAEENTAEANTEEVSTEEEEEMSENPNLAIRRDPQEDHYIFELSENVERTQVYYKNRFGIEIAGDLYIAKDADLSQQYPALVIGPPFGGVKEQGPGVYANELAQRGFVVLAFDPSYHGYSGGEPRMTGSTAMYVEDFSAGVDLLGSLDYVDRERIGAMGICGSGGFALAAATMDTRIKAVAPVVMYDIAGLNNSRSGEARQEMLTMASEQRWEEFGTDEAAWRVSYPEEPTEEIPEGLDDVTAEFYSFYGTERGWHPNALGNVTNASFADLMTFPALTHISELNGRPVLFVAGENAHSLAYSEDAYADAAEPKELYIVPDANHVDLYDQVDKIPFDKLESFFKESM